MFRPKVLIIFLSLYCAVWVENAVAEGCKNLDDSLPLTSHDFPDEAPEAIRALFAAHNLSKQSQDEIFLSCSQKNSYADAMKNLESTLVRVALKMPSLTEALKKINRRSFDLIQVQAIVNAKNNSDGQPSEELIKQETDKLLVRYFSDCEGVSGCVGSDPKRIEEALLNGNIRELNHMNGESGTRLFASIIDKHCSSGSKNCVCWQNPLDPRVASLCKNSSFLVKMLSRGRFSKINKSYRINAREGLEKLKKDLDYRTKLLRLSSSANRRTFEEAYLAILTQYTQMQENINKRSRLSVYKKDELIVPLSDREQEYLREIGQNTDRVHMRAGMSRYLKVFPPAHVDPGKLYYGVASKHGFDVKVSPSGTADDILTLGCIYGNGKGEQESLRMAGLVNMTLHNHHTPYETLIAGLSFEGLQIQLNSDYYKQVYSTQPDFALQVEQDYKLKYPESDLPTAVLENCVSAALYERSTQTGAGSCEEWPFEESQLEHAIIEEQNSAMEIFKELPF